jgi:hypothetical protein
MYVAGKVKCLAGNKHLSELKRHRLKRNRMTGTGKRRCFKMNCIYLKGKRSWLAGERMRSEMEVKR